MKAFIYFSILTLMISCTHGKKNFSVTKDFATPEFQYFNINNRVLLSGLPSDLDLKILKEKGINRVIDLRPSTEAGDYSSTVEKLDIQFNRFVYLNNNSIDKEQANKLERLLKNNPNETVLIHCASGNRAASWLAYHMKNSHKYSTTQAIQFAKKMGLTSAPLEELTRKTLEAN